MADKTSLVVKVLGDVKDIKKKLDTLDKRVKKTSKATQKFHASIKKGFMNFLKYTALIGTTILALRKLTSVVTSSLKAYRDQLEAETKLNAALKSTGQWTQSVEEDLISFAEELQRTTGIADDLTIAAAGIMTTFTQINTETFPEAITLAADMSKMFGQDLQQSVIQLGTALNDPIRGVGRLRRIGISFSETQKEMIAGFMEQNDLMSAQRVILDELQMEIGGTAKALGDTYAGQVDKLKSAHSDLKQEMGEMMARGIKPMLPLIMSMVENLKSWIEETNNLKDAKARLRAEQAGEIELTVMQRKQDEQLLEMRQLNRKEIELEGAIRTVMQHGNQEYIDTIKAEINAMRISIRARAALIDNMELAVRMRDEGEKEILEGIKAKDAEKKSIDDLINSTDEWANTIVMTGQEALFLREQVDSNIEANKEWNAEINNLNESLEAGAAWVTTWADAFESSIEKVDEDVKTLLEEWEEDLNKFVDIWDMTFGAISSATDEFMNNRSIAIENDYEKQRQAIMNNITDETERKEALEALDEEFGAKRRKLAREQAERDKRQAVFGAVINTALAVTKALGSAIPPLNFILAAIVGATGALQIAAIAARPLPALQEGGIAIQDTLARIGEGGTREAVIPLSAEGLRPFAEAIVTELQRIGSPGRPIVNQGDTFVQVGNGPIIRTVQKAMDNQQLRVNAKAIR